MVGNGSRKDKTGTINENETHKVLMWYLMLYPNATKGAR